MIATIQAHSGAPFLKLGYTAVTQNEQRPNDKKGLHAFACNPLILLLLFGAADRNRTGDLRITNVKVYAFCSILDHFTNQ